MTMISVIIPTIKGREGHFLRCMNAYIDNSVSEIQLISEHDHPSCGLGWQAGLDKVAGDYVHLTCDDIEPKQGWDVAAIEAIERGYLPAPQCYTVRGEPESAPKLGEVGKDWAPVHMSGLPFAARWQMDKIAPLLTCHYFTDDFFSWRGSRLGWPIRLRTGYAFIHHRAQLGRGAGMGENERLEHDGQLYLLAKMAVRMGQWTEPWPKEGR